MKIRRFTDAMEVKIDEVEDGQKKEKLVRWLRWARDKADWFDPLTDKVDDLLGNKGQHISAENFAAEVISADTCFVVIVGRAIYNQSIIQKVFTESIKSRIQALFLTMRQ